MSTVTDLNNITLYRFIIFILKFEKVNLLPDYVFKIVIEWQAA